MKKAFLIILCCCLLVTTAFAPITKAHAMAGTLTVGIGVVAFVVGALGLTFATQGDFRQACQACFNAMPKDMKDFIEANTIYDADLQKLKLTALVTQVYFKEVFQNIVDFFKGDSITVVEPSPQWWLENTTPHVFEYVQDAQYYVSENYSSFTNRLSKNTEWSFTFENSQGTYITYSNKFDGLYGAGLYIEYSNITRCVSWSLKETEIVFYPCQVNNKVFFMYVKYNDGNTFSTYGATVPDIQNTLKSVIPDSDKDIFIHDTPGAIDAGVVLDGMQTAGESDAGLVLDIPTVGVLDEVYGDDTTAENPYTGTQSGTLSQSGVISNIDTTLNPVLDDYKAETEVNGQHVGLGDVFPFCIPFDIYDMLKGLAANRQAPHFEWNLKYKDLVDYTFVIDFEQFETVAVVLRTLELLAFCVGLAFVTRHLLRS